MPRVKSVKVKTLLDSCVEYVADNLDLWCDKSEIQQNDLHHDDIDISRSEEIDSSPFAILPPVVLENLITTFGRKNKIKNKIKKKHFKMLVTQSLINLDMSLCETNDIPCIFDLTLRKCPNLTTLRFIFPKFEDVGLQSSAIKFEKLQILDISCTAAGDSCLRILGTFCKMLRKLNLTYCENVSDTGIIGLCVSTDIRGENGEISGQCKSIENLCATGTKITKKGIQLALRNMPALRVFHLQPGYGSFDDTVTLALAETHKEDFLNNKLQDIRKYNLIHLSLNRNSGYSSSYFTAGLELVAHLCPLITIVEIDLIKGLTDIDLLGLRSLKSVSQFMLCGKNDGKEEVTFHGGVVPLLKSFGSSLDSLSFCDLINVNILAIAEFCPNLSALVLTNNRCYKATQSRDEASPSHLRQLKELTLQKLEKLHLACQHKEIFCLPSNHLMTLLSSSSLTSVYISKCELLTNDILMQADKIHNFLNLESLHLSYCHSVTRQGIDILMNTKNSLKSIYIDRCRELKQEDFNDWIIKTKSENWQLSISRV